MPQEDITGSIVLAVTVDYDVPLVDWQLNCCLCLTVGLTAAFKRKSNALRQHQQVLCYVFYTVEELPHTRIGKSGSAIFWLCRKYLMTIFSVNDTKM